MCDIDEKFDREKETSEVQDKSDNEGNAQETKNQKKKAKKKMKAAGSKQVPEKPQQASKKQSSASKMVKRLQEATAEAERIKKEQEEMERKLEEERQKELERIRLEEEKRARKKQKEKERKQRLKQEGKLLTRAEKEKRNKNKENLQRMLDRGAIVTALSQNQEKSAEPEAMGTEEKSEHDNKLGEEVKTGKEIEKNEVDNQSDQKAEDNGFISEVEHERIHHKPLIADPVERIKMRRAQSKNNASIDHLRAPIICVMGHVDTGKTKILDKLRNTHVQDGEAGGITQQIGVTNVPLSAIKKSVSHIKEMEDFKYRIAGLSIIDTPGHFSFKNLRSLGSSLCDMAILIVDIMHSVEPQTEESIRLLREKKTPFVIALNKIDLIVDWNSCPTKSIKDLIDSQPQRTKSHFEDLFSRVFSKFSELGLNIALFYDNSNPKRFIDVVPTSAKTGDGVGDLIAHICTYTQTRLEQKLLILNEIDATVMEVKVIPGLGPTIDVILVNGTLRRGDKIVVAGFNEPLVSQIRALLTPQPMKEMRVKGTYIQHDKISISQGVKISGPNLDTAVAGLPLYVAEYDDEIEFYKNELSTLIEKTLGSFEKKEKGVYVQASTIGSLEALLDFLRRSNIPYFGINIGPVHKRDVITATTMLEHEPMYAVILAFDVKIESDAQALADKSGVKIFSADIIYHLYDQYVEYEKNYKMRKADEFRHLAIFPCILRILPEHIFKTRDPIIVGVIIEDGIAKIGTPLCVPTKQNLIIGTIASIEHNHKNIEVAKKGQEVSIKIVQMGEEAPKLLGRHFTQDDLLVSKISRESIDLLKNYFREELGKSDWKLIMDLKKTFEII